MWQVSVTVWCPSICPIYLPLQQHAAGLLLWAWHAGDISRLVHGWHPAATAQQQNRL